MLKKTSTQKRHSKEKERIYQQRTLLGVYMLDLVKAHITTQKSLRIKDIIYLTYDEHEELDVTSFKTNDVTLYNIIKNKIKHKGQVCIYIIMLQSVIISLKFLLNRELNLSIYMQGGQKSHIQDVMGNLSEHWHARQVGVVTCSINI